MRDQLEQYVKQVKEYQELCETEEATKYSLIAPLFTLLGWNLNNPVECVPQYKADFGYGVNATKPADWAFRMPPYTCFIVEAKKRKVQLQKTSPQLAMYFAQSQVNLGIFTNGTHWQFYTDLELSHIMDSKPFLTWDVLTDEAIPFDFLALLQRSQFKPGLVRTFAEHLTKQNLLVQELSVLLEPSPEFTRLALQKLETGSLTASVVAQWKPILANALQEWSKLKVMGVAQTWVDKKPVPQVCQDEPKKKKVKDGKVSKAKVCRDILQKDPTGTYKKYRDQLRPQGIKSFHFANVKTYLAKKAKEAEGTPAPEPTTTLPFSQQA